MGVASNFLSKAPSVFEMYTTIYVIRIIMHINFFAQCLSASSVLNEDGSPLAWRKYKVYVYLQMEKIY